MKTSHATIILHSFIYFLHEQEYQKLLKPSGNTLITTYLNLMMVNLLHLMLTKPIQAILASENQYLASILNK